MISENFTHIKITVKQEKDKRTSFLNNFSWNSLITQSYKKTPKNHIS